MYELIEALQCATNIKRVTYHAEYESWSVEFYNGKPVDGIDSSDLIEFLRNG